MSPHAGDSITVAMLVLQSICALFSAGALGAALKLIFDAGKLVERVHSLELRISDIDLYGCRKARSECAEGD